MRLCCSQTPEDRFSRIVESHIEKILLPMYTSLQPSNSGDSNSYGKCYKVLNTFYFLFSMEMWVKRWNSQNTFRIANKEDPDQTASEAVRSGSALFV